MTSRVYNIIEGRKAVLYLELLAVPDLHGGVLGAANEHAAVR